MTRSGHGCARHEPRGAILNWLCENQPQLATTRDAGAEGRRLGHGVTREAANRRRDLGRLGRELRHRAVLQATEVTYREFQHRAATR